MIRNVLITGGAGFIGSHLADELLESGYRVRVLDSLSPQVHGESGTRPEYLSPRIDLMVGDIRDPQTIARSLDGIDAVYHFAARVGVGQSMYEIHDYVDVNDTGTAVLLQELIKHPVQRLIVASSMSVYGEGLYKDQDGNLIENQKRSVPPGSTVWDPLDALGRPLEPIPTPESKQPALASVYALGKYVQERMCLMVGKTYDIPTVALRFFNAYGTRQALSNPYTGVLAIFASRLLNDQPPVIFEDGLQRRDFVHVADVVRSCLLSLEGEEAPGNVFNIGSGNSVTIKEIAQRVAGVMNKGHIKPRITGKHRVGDIRHCFADITLAREVLQYEPQVEFNEGLLELALWLADQKAEDRYETMTRELENRGLTV
ncbi:MAG: NAD-dependent epimerase/dehydratase family protein [Desulfovibrionales bacterium]